MTIRCRIALVEPLARLDQPLVGACRQVGWTDAVELFSCLDRDSVANAWVDGYHLCIW